MLWWIALVVGCIGCFTCGYSIASTRSKSDADHRVYLAERKARWLNDWVIIAAKHHVTLAKAQREIELALCGALGEYNAAPGCESQICNKQPDQPRGYE